jgi:hypothetical protein
LSALQFHALTTVPRTVGRFHTANHVRICADMEVEVGPILDWSVTLNGKSACVCIQTAHAWYRIIKPASDYDPLFFLCQLFAHLCNGALAALAEVPSVEFDPFLVLICRYLLQKYPKESLLFHVKVSNCYKCNVTCSAGKSGQKHARMAAICHFPHMACCCVTAVAVCGRRLRLTVLPMLQCGTSGHGVLIITTEPACVAL